MKVSTSAECVIFVAVCADIDYVKLMDEKTPPKDILAPYLTSTNINNVMKLAAKIPDKVSTSFLCSVHTCFWLELGLN